eukprot:5177607-Alexandrium_andersonii.AAC.1
MGGSLGEVAKTAGPRRSVTSRLHPPVPPCGHDDQHDWAVLIGHTWWVDPTVGRGGGRKGGGRGKRGVA